MICDEIGEFDRVWPWVEKAVEQDIGGLSHSKQDVIDMLGRGEAILFTTPKSAILVNFIHHPKVKMMNVWAAGGKLKEIIGEGLNEIEAFAKKFGYSHIIGSGRDTWGRVLKTKGFTPAHVTFLKEIK